MLDQSQWKWYGHAGHFICSRWCRFHLCTEVGNFLISTVGEYWPDRPVREIHAQVQDPIWLSENCHLKGNSFDAAYMSRFGFERLGAGEDSIYETLVFRLTGERCATTDCGCGLPTPHWSEVDGRRAAKAGEATKNHYEFCETYADERAETTT